MKVGSAGRKFGAMLIAALAIVAPQAVFASSSEFDYLTLGAMEMHRSDKQWCEGSYPEFKDRNDTAFSESIFSQMTGEEFIQSNATGELRQNLLAFLSKLRTDRRNEYTKLPPHVLKAMCTFFVSDIGKQNMRAAREPQKSNGLQ